MNNNLAVQCESVNKHYPNFQLNNLNFDIEKGSVMGLVGPNGAGKSTLIRIIMGLISFDKGHVKVLGQEMPKHQVAAKSEVGFVSEDMRLYGSETIAFHMAFIKSIFDSWDSQYADTLLKRFDLSKHQKVRELSHGQRVKATLLLAMARRPSLLVFDEPTTGLDPSARKEVLNEMMNAMEDETRTILFSSHNTLDVEQISDYITFLYGGQVLESQDKESFLESWRRIRLSNVNNIPLPELSNARDIKESGHLAAITVNNFSHETVQKIEKSGLKIETTERLTLEEIFLCNVEYARRSKS